MPKYTPQEFIATHASNMRSDVMFTELPFYQWLKEQSDPPGRFADALFAFYEGHDIKGAFTDEELDSYKIIHQHFWWEKHQNETRID